MPTIKAIAPGTIVFHPHRGYGVLTKVNLMTGWVGARFGDEVNVLDLSLSDDGLTHADGEPILFRRSAPDYMPHARLMAMVRNLHAAGYERLYLYAWPKASGLHWRWHLFTGNRAANRPAFSGNRSNAGRSSFWVHRPLRPGWYGSGSDYIFNPVMGWGDTPGASTEELIRCLATHDPEGLAQALGPDAEHTAWFASVCDALLPNYAYSLGWQFTTRPKTANGANAGANQRSLLLQPTDLPVIAVKRGLKPYVTNPDATPLAWPPGWANGWAHRADTAPLRRVPSET
jgi:hypothetical protein